MKEPILPAVLKAFLFFGLINISTNSLAQGSDDPNAIDPAPFADAAHHWYDIHEKTNIIFAKPNQPRYKNTDLK